MAKNCGIVLAGGRARRFQVKGGPWTDKALASILGKPMLIHVIEGLRPVVEEIIICVDSEVRRRRYTKLLRDHSLGDAYIRIVIDLKIPFIRGPAVAITTGLNAASADNCVVVPCDAPFIQPTVIDYLLSALKDASLAAPIHTDGSVETVIFACRRQKTAEVSETLCWLGRDRPDDLLRGLPKVNFISVSGELKDLDPEFKSFININFREDLVDLRSRVVAEGPIKESIHIDLGSPESSEMRTLREAAKKCLDERFAEAADIFSHISSLFEEKRLYFWAGLCREKEGISLQRLLKGQRNTLLRSELREKSRRAFMRASQNYALEAEVFAQKQIHLLAKRAREDEIWCKGHME